MTLRVVLAEDSLIVREGVTRVLERSEDIELIAICADAATLRATIAETDPDVVLTDIRMPPSETDEGIRIAEELRISHPRIGVVVLSHYAEPAYASALFAAGPERRAYLLKDHLRYRGELSHAIRSVAAGGSVVDARVVQTLLDRSTRRHDSKFETLTPREREILAMIAEGHSNGAVADALVITKRVVEHHINNIFLKLDLGDTKDVSRRVKATLTFLAEGES